MRKASRELFMKKVSPEPNSGCWLWTATYDHQGYGRLRVDKKMTGAHRASWVYEYGPIPDRLCVLHRCDNPACVNPKHLFLGTLSDNTKDMVRKGRQGGGPPPGRRLLSTHCRAGHEFTETNTYFWKSFRVCRRCSALAQSRRAARLRAAAGTLPQAVAP